jgi:hypothetical protein
MDTEMGFVAILGVVVVVLLILFAGHRYFPF